MRLGCLLYLVLQRQKSVWAFQEVGPLANFLSRKKQRQGGLGDP